MVCHETDRRGVALFLMRMVLIPRFDVTAYAKMAKELKSGIGNLPNVSMKSNRCY